MTISATNCGDMMPMKTTPILLIGLVLVLAATAAVGLLPLDLGAQNMGAQEIKLAGGSRGEVPFPHLNHQNKLVDCNICHSIFPQTKGSIAKLKAEGKLKSKQVMNTHCIKCHKAEKRAGNASGPTTCAKCHVRS
jgi:hypothetical protein